MKKINFIVAVFTTALWMTQGEATPSAAIPSAPPAKFSQTNLVPAMPVITNWPVTNLPPTTNWPSTNLPAMTNPPALQPPGGK